MKVCSYCGKENEDVAEQCIGCGVDIEAKVQKLTKAGFGIRTLARLIDMVFFLMIGYLASLIAVIIVYFLSRMEWIEPGWPARVREITYGGFLLGLLANILYHSFCEGLHGATIGKLMCGLRVVQQDGSPSTLKGAFLRSLLYPLDSFCFGLIAFMTMDNSPLNQRVGDVCGKTAVLKTFEVRPESRRTLGIFFAGLITGVLTNGFIVVIAIIYNAR